MRPEPGAVRVLMVLDSYYPFAAGTERQVQLLTRALVDRGIPVEVIASRRAYRQPARDIVDGIPVYRLSSPRVPYLATLGMLGRLALWLLGRGRRFDVFHVHVAGPVAVVATLVGRWLGKRVVVKAVGWWELERGVLNPVHRRRLGTRLALAVLRRTDIWIAVSRALERAMRAAGIPDARIRRVPNGVDTARFVPGDRDQRRRELGFVPSRQRVVFVGRLVPEKGLETLLRAWRRVVAGVPDAILDIVGTGPLRDVLERQGQELGLGGSIALHGRQEDVLPYLQAADGFILPSSVEGLSNTLLEAMAVGLPVVATRISGCEDLVEDRATGLLVPPGDEEALARSLLAVLTHGAAARAMGGRARERVTAACATERVVATYVELYGAGRPVHAATLEPPPTSRSIAYVVSLFPCWSETFILREILALHRRGVPVRIFSLRPPSEQLVQDAARPLLAGVVYPRPAWRVALAVLRVVRRRPRVLAGLFGTAIREARASGATEVAKAFYTVAAATHFAEMARRLGLGHVHVHWATYPGLAARVIHTLIGLRYTLTAHAHDIFLPNPYLSRNLAEAHGVVTISEYNRRYLVALGVQGEKIQVVPCGLDLGEFPPDDACDRIPGSIVAIGRLEPTKGLLKLVEACVILRDRGCEFTCELIGEGSLRPLLEQLIAVSRLEGRVRLRGALDQRHVQNALRSAEVFVLPSARTPSGDQDGIPVALIEAMATGLPVVTTRVSGIPELVTDGRSGLLIAPNDPVELANALERVLKNPRLRDALGIEARRAVHERHDMASSVGRLTAIFDEAMIGR